MSSSYVEELAEHNTSWFRIVHALLAIADIKINGSLPFDIRVRNPDFYKRVLREGSCGLGESYMDGWWECDRLDCFFGVFYAHGLRKRPPIEKKAPYHLKGILHIVAAYLINLQSRNRAWIVGE